MQVANPFAHLIEQLLMDRGGTQSGLSDLLYLFCIQYDDLQD